MTYMATPQHKNPCLEDHEIDNFGRPFPWLSSSEFYPRVKKNNAFSLYDIWPRPRSRAAVPGVIKFTFWEKLFLVHHHYTLSLYESCPGGEKKICVINANMDRVGIYHPSIPSISLLFKLAVELKPSGLKKSWDRYNSFYAKSCNYFQKFFLSTVWTREFNIQDIQNAGHIYLLIR